MFEGFRERLREAAAVVVLTGAGVSAESGVPTFRSAGGLWRKHEATQLATPQAFAQDASLVWEFYSWRRNVVAKCAPNAGHFAITELQQQLLRAGKQFTLITQNVDRLHHAAGTRDAVEMHGSLWLVKPVSHPGFVEEAGLVWEDRTIPICPALANRGDPEATAGEKIPVGELPHSATGELLRPAVVWFGENLDSRVVQKIDQALRQCDLLIVAGTSSVVFPAASYAPLVESRGGTVAEFNMEDTPITRYCEFKFRGPSAELLPKAFRDL